jgi:hypothetical protein
MFAVWTMSRPALAASAPFCDDRGASAIAAPPALQAPGAAIERTVNASCEADEPLTCAVVAPAHRSVTRPVAVADFTLCSAPVVLRPSSSCAIRAPASTNCPPAGVSVRVERPPRG